MNIAIYTVDDEEPKHSIGWTIWCTCNECHAATSGYCPDLREVSNQSME